MTFRHVRQPKEVFLAAFAQTGNVSEAARRAKVDRTTPYVWRKMDAEFGEGWTQAELAATEVLEKEAWRRGNPFPVVTETWEVKRNGDGEPVLDDKGQPTLLLVKRETTVKASDTLLMFLLKARAPEKYRERADLHLHGQVGIEERPDLSKLSDEELESLARLVGKAHADAAAA